MTPILKLSILAHHWSDEISFEFDMIKLERNVLHVLLNTVIEVVIEIELFNFNRLVVLSFERKLHSMVVDEIYHHLEVAIAISGLLVLNNINMTVLSLICFDVSSIKLD